MDDMKLDQELRAFDFSEFSKVKESLLQELLEMHRRDNASPKQWIKGRLSEEDLDMVVAAGSNPHGCRDHHVEE